jgi:2-polyprenyl-6-methoxyphenol hydroxylase-like FAD-dependent oxidoreductase
MANQATQPGIGTGRAPDEAVLVVGAGPTGLMMAAELARHGVRARLVDAAPEPSTRSKAIGVQARTLEIFEHLGIAGEALASGRPIHGVNLTSTSTIWTLRTRSSSRCPSPRRSASSPSTRRGSASPWSATCASRR